MRQPIATVPYGASTHDGFFLGSGSGMEASQVLVELGSTPVSVSVTVSDSVSDSSLSSESRSESSSVSASSSGWETLIGTGLEGVEDSGGLVGVDLRERAEE